MISANPAVMHVKLDSDAARNILPHVIQPNGLSRRQGYLQRTVRLFDKPFYQTFFVSGLT